MEGWNHLGEADDRKIRKEVEEVGGCRETNCLHRHQSCILGDFLLAIFVLYNQTNIYERPFLKKNINDSIFVLYPNFQAYTELAIAASNRLIIPLNAGKSSYCEQEKGQQELLFLLFYCYCEKGKGQQQAL